MESTSDRPKQNQPQIRYFLLSRVLLKVWIWEEKGEREDGILWVLMKRRGWKTKKENVVLVFKSGGFFCFFWRNIWVGIFVVLVLDTLSVRTYVIHLLGIYVTILCNWFILWQNALYLYLGRFRMCLNTSRNHVSRSSVEVFKSVQENKLKVQNY